MVKYLSVGLVAGLMSFASGLVAVAQDYPARPIEVIVPYAAGGASDTVVRAMQQVLADDLPQPLVVINKPGAGGSLGNREVKDAAPDGYTILSTHQGMSVNEALGVTDFNYESFELIAETGAVELVFAVPANSPYQTLSDLVEAAKAAPDTITHATNLGSVVHFATLGLSDASGAKLRYVQVGGGGARIPQLLGNQVDTSLFGVAEILPYYNSGEVRILAILADERWPDMPDVPTARELGYDFAPISVGYWWFAPEQTPRQIVDYLADKLRGALENEDIQSDFAERGFRATFKAGEEFRAAVADQHKMIHDLAQKFGVTQN